MSGLHREAGLLQLLGCCAPLSMIRHACSPVFPASFSLLDTRSPAARVEPTPACCSQPGAAAVGTAARLLTPFLRSRLHSAAGPVSLLSGLNPRPSVLVMHFFMVALFGVGRWGGGVIVLMGGTGWQPAPGRWHMGRWMEPQCMLPLPVCPPSSIAALSPA